MLMSKLSRYPVRLLFIAFSISILLFTGLYWGYITNNTIVLNSPAHISFIHVINDLLKGIAVSLRLWFVFICSVALLYILFLLILKIVCRIKIKELLLFSLITTHGLFFTFLFFADVFQNAIANYLFPVSLILFNFFLLKLSNYWNYTAERLPD